MKLFPISFRRGGGRNKNNVATESHSAQDLREIRELHQQVKALLEAPLPSKGAYPIKRSQTAEYLKATIKRIEKSIVEQGETLMEQNRMLKEKLAILLDDDDEEELPTEIQTGSFVITAAGTKWRVGGYSSAEPVPDYNYFPGLTWTCEKNERIEFKYSNDRVISAIVPCFNEQGKDLLRTVNSLYRQRLAKGWRLEVVIVMDGADQMHPDMATFLSTMFGVKINSGDPELDPFVALPDSETIIIDPFDKEAALSRKPAVQFLNCTYSLATDCGTVFARTATQHLIRRMDREPNLHAVTGFQRIMTSEMQGDGVFELLNHPFNFLLRMVQRFEFEVDHVSFKSVYDSLGCMHVIPGPCGLFRYNAMGTLKEGLMQNYFRVFQTSNKGLIAGNVELVEDRIPGTLLSFPPRSFKERPVMPPEGWPRTGFCYDAVFYIEAEKPLSQLVKQRRRWLNGTFATYVWMLMEGIVSRSNQDPFNRFLSWILVVVNVIQGLVVRLFGPAILIVWMFRFGLFIPDILSDPAVIFDPALNLVSLEIEEGRLIYGASVALAYLSLFIAFIVGHTPVATPVAHEVPILRYTEAKEYRSDNASAYRGWLFIPVLWVNVLVVCLYIVNTIGIIYTQGWSGTPILVRILVCICFSPFVMGILDGLLRCDLRCFWGMCYSAPFALPLMIWFNVWIPAYTTTRLSDLTWGNRETASLDGSKKALERARNGRRVAWVLILFNSGVAFGVILLMQSFSRTFPIFVISYTSVLSFTYVISFIDLAARFFSCAHLDPWDDEPMLIEEGDQPCACICGDENATDGSSDGYVEMDNGLLVMPGDKSNDEIGI